MMLTLRVPPWRVKQEMEEMQKRGPVQAGVVEQCSCPSCGWIYIAPDSGYVHDTAESCPWVAL